MIINIAIVDDSKSYLKVMEILLQNLKNELKVSLNIETFSSPLEYKLSNINFDIAIIDCIFKAYPVNINGLNLASFTKNKNKNTRVILTTEYAGQEFQTIITEYNKAIDYYSTKRIEDSSIIYKVREFIEEIRGKNETLGLDVTFKLHVYKRGKELLKFSEINYATVADRAKHLIKVGTVKGEKLLSMTLSNFLTVLNDGFKSAGINKDEEKLKSDLYVNIFNVASVDKKNYTVKFKSNEVITIDSMQELESIETRLHAIDRILL